MSIKEGLLRYGITAKPLALRMGCTGDGKLHNTTSYSSVKRSTCKAHAQILMATGFSGVVHIWNGTANTFVHDAMMQMWEECLEYGLLFSVMLDQWIVPHTGASALADAGVITTNLNSADFQRVFNSDAYIPEKYLMEFDLDSSLNAPGTIADVQKSNPGIPILSDGTGFTWPDASAGGDPIGKLINQYKNPAVKVAGLCYQFFDGGYFLPNGVNGPTTNGRDWNGSMWNRAVPTRVLPHQAGKYYWDQVRVTPKNIPYAMYATLDDDREGTPLEGFLSMMANIEIT